MLIEIHAIQNHSPANLNRDDLGAPKTCYFGGVLRSRISSQAIKRSIRMSKEFQELLGGRRTRQLAKVIVQRMAGDDAAEKRAAKILEMCGFKPKAEDRSKMLVYTTDEAIGEMAEILRSEQAKEDEQLARDFAQLIANRTAVPDMALSGRMLEPDESGKKVWDKLETTVEAALQVAHAISTHEARPEVDYYVAKDDVPGEDAGAGFVDEAMFASACFYKYFSINWETLIGNLKGYGEKHKELAAHTVGAFLRGMALVNPSGKQNSFAAHNRPDGILVEIRDTPINYMNAFASPVTTDERDVISQSIAQLGQYIHDLDTGYGRPQMRLWFSPNGRYPLTVRDAKEDRDVADRNLTSLEDLVRTVIKEIGYDWDAVQPIALNARGAV